MTAARQLALDLPWREALGREDFLVSEANRAAVALVDAWPDWPHCEAMLIGPAGSGKTHLVEVWATHSSATRLAAGALRADIVPALADCRALAIEDCGSGLDETALVHLLNETSRRGANLLLTAKEPPSDWQLTLPDLRSRLNRMARVQLHPPDEALMQAVLVKLLADRQLQVTPVVVSYLTMRLERSFSALREAVARLDRMAIEEHRRVTRALAARALAEMGIGDD